MSIRLGGARSWFKLRLPGLSGRVESGQIGLGSGRAHLISKWGFHGSRLGWFDLMGFGVIMGNTWGRGHWLGFRVIMCEKGDGSVYVLFWGPRGPKIGLNTSI